MSALVPLGRPPKPSALRIVEGMRGHRPLPPAEPQPRNIVPACPEWFSDLQRAYWDAIVGTMTPVAGWLTEDQGPLLMVLAEACATWEQTTRFLMERGHSFDHEQHYIDENGTPAYKTYPKVRPEVKIQKEARSDILRYIAALGLGPVFKARVNLVPNEDAEDLDRAP